jgi:hypothetical protein
VTLLTAGHVPDAVYEEVRRSFNDDELVGLTLAVVVINGFKPLQRRVPDRTRRGTSRPTNRPRRQPPTSASAAGPERAVQGPAPWTARLTASAAIPPTLGERQWLADPLSVDHRVPPHLSRRMFEAGEGVPSGAETVHPVLA